MGKKSQREERYEMENGAQDQLTEQPGGVNNSEKGTPYKYDPDFKGPVRKRSCRDVICCGIFFIFICGLGVVAYFAYAYGSPYLLLYPTNSEGKLCGYGNLKDKQYLLFYDLIDCAKLGPGVFINGCPTTQVCVSKCPNKTEVLFNDALNILECKTEYCTNTTGDCRARIKAGQCPSYVIESTDVLFRCVPDAGKVVEKVFNKVGTAVNQSDITLAQKVLEQFLKLKEYTDKIIHDVTVSWWMILVGLLLAMVLSFIWITLMRWLAAPMVWITIILFIGLFAFSCYYCFSSYIKTKDTEDEYKVHLVVMTFSFKQATFWLVFGIISAVFLLIIVLILLFLRKRILIATALIKEGSKAVGSMMFTLIWPIIPFILQVGIITMWLTIAVFLASVGRSAGDNRNVTTLFQEIDCDVKANGSLGEFCTFINYGTPKYTFYLQIYNLFMLFWLVNFVIALGQITLAGAFASYYWAFSKPRDIPSLPLTYSFGRAFRYHLGSLAFGSLIIAIVQLIRVFLEYLDNKLKASQNECARFFLKCLMCCFWCLEKFLRFLNKNAYIMIAVSGKSFCTSAKNAFFLILRNVVRVIVVDKVTDFLLFIGKLVIVGAITTLAYFFFDGRLDVLNTFKPSLNFYLTPIVIIALGSYIIAGCFFSVYSMAVDTLFLCALEDMERNDGSKERPYYMSANLRGILGKKNKVVKQE